MFSRRVARRGGTVLIALAAYNLHKPTYYCYDFDKKGFPEEGESPNNTTPLYLTAVGMRQKRILFVDVDVYLVGASLSSSAISSARAWKNSADGTSLAARVLENNLVAAADGSAVASVKLKFVRTVTSRAIIEAFNEAFSGQDQTAVKAFQSAFSSCLGQNIAAGSVIEFFWMRGGGLLISVGGTVKGSFTDWKQAGSKGVEQRLLQIYLDHNSTVSPELVASFVANIDHIEIP